MPKVSPNFAIARAMAEAKYVDAGPTLFCAGGYSPMTGKVLAHLKIAINSPSGRFRLGHSSPRRRLIIICGRPLPAMDVEFGFGEVVRCSHMSGPSVRRI